MRRRPSASPETGPPRKPTQPTDTLILDFRLRTEKINSFKPQACGIPPPGIEITSLISQPPPEEELSSHLLI